MAYRPYPSRERALAQLHRGRRPVPPSELQLRLAEQASAALEYAGRAVESFARGLRPRVPVDEYRLSTR